MTIVTPGALVVIAALAFVYYAIDISTSRRVQIAGLAVALLLVILIGAIALTAGAVA